MEDLDRKASSILSGKVVRKDLVRKVKVGTNVPVFVLEYLLGKYCATDDPVAIDAGLKLVNATLAENFVRPDEANKAQSFVKEKGVNSFDFELPSSKVKVKFKLLTQADQKKIQAEVDRNKKTFNGESKLSSTQLKYQIISVNGDSSPHTIKDFIDNGLMINDARSLRKYIESIQPGVDLSMEVTDRETNEPFQTDITLGVQFFWPDAKV